MLPGALFSTYKQYKEDTKKVVEWLATNARICGYDPGNVVPDAPKGPKLKGRARKLARDAAANAAKQSQGKGTSAKETIVKTKDFIPMATAIVNSSDAKVLIPLSILRTWRDCITARTDTAKWYETDIEVEEKDIGSNESHAFFVEVLKKALQLLVPIAKLQELDRSNFHLTKTSGPAAEISETTANRFQHLEIQDIDEEAYGKLPNVTTDSTGKAKNTGPKPKYALEELDEWSEYLFALNCFMTDVHNLRYQLQQCWELYAEAEIDLTTASVTTNIAIEMVKRAEDEFSKIKPPEQLRRIGYTSIPQMWFMEACIEAGIPPPKRHDPDKFFVPMEAWEQAQESYLHLFRFLQVYSNGVMPHTSGRDRIFALTRPAYFGTYNPELEWDELSPERQYEQVAALVNDMLVTVGAFVMLSDSPNDDMLMQGLAKLQQNQIEPPFWLLFAVQNFVDIHMILKTRSERPYEELRDFALTAKRTLKEHQAFMENHPLTLMRPQEDELAIQETLREIEEWVLEDKIKQILSSTSQKAATRKIRVWQDFEVMRMSPVFCGMLKYCFHVQMQWKGITLVNDTGIVTAAHLYNALFQNGYLGKKDPVVWEDLEYLLELHKVEDTFLGERPKSIEACTKRLALVQGVAPSTFARRRRGNNNRVLRSRAGSKFLAPSTPVAQIMGQKFLTETESDWHLDQLDTIVAQKFDKDMKAMKKYDEEMNAKVEAINTETYDGMVELLDVFAPKVDELYDKGEFGKIQGWSRVTFKKVFAKMALNQHEAPFYAKWSVATREALRKLPDEPVDPDSDDELTIKTTRNEKAVGGPELPPILDVDDGPSQPSRAEEFLEIMDRWKKSKTLPLEIFVDIVQDSLRNEFLDIQFDYFAFFRSAFSMMLEIKDAVAPILQARVTEEGGRVSQIFALNEGAVCIMPQLSMLMACDPLEAPNIINLRPWLEIDLRPLQLAARIMKPWIEENGDIYCVTEDEREEMRTANVLKEGPKVKYVDDEPSDSTTPTERKVGWSSATGLIENLNAREMREVFDVMKNEGLMGATTAEVMARMGKTELSKEDRELVELRTGIARDVKKRKHNKTRSKNELVDDTDDDTDEWYESEDEHNDEELSNGRQGTAEFSHRQASQGHAYVEDDVD